MKVQLRCHSILIDWKPEQQHCLKEPIAFSTFSIKILMEDTEEINKSNMKYRRFIEV